MSDGENGREGEDLDTSEDLARTVVERFAARGWMLATAESCTGGMIAAAITEIAGSSAVLDRGFVTYSNAAKEAMIAVRADTLARHGAVSRQTAVEMAEGALIASKADVAVAVTGIAGPDGGTADKPVGLVHMAIAMRHDGVHHNELRFGNIGRRYVREATVRAALAMLSAFAQADVTPE